MVETRMSNTIARGAGLEGHGAVDADTRESEVRAGHERLSARGLDRSEIGELIAKDYVGLRRLLARRAGDPQVAADLLNDAVCTTWEKWCAGQIQRPEQIAGYIFQVAMNLLRNRRRLVADRADRRANVEQLDREKIASAPAEHEAEEELAGRLKTLIRSMDSQRDRVVLVRFYLDEEEKESICQDLQLEARQFDRVLHRARQRLRALLTGRGLGKGDFLCVVWVL
jgi:RNA polymerase sigma-70 factor (ECF subfamily)